MTLIGKGIGKDFISDFSVNLIFEYLLEYTQEFALNNLPSSKTKKFTIRCKFNNELMVWTPREFILPYFYLENGDFILLTPMDILTKDESYICGSDLRINFRSITNAIGNSSLRDAINSYFHKRLPRNAKKKDIDHAIFETINKYPEILDYYISFKEKNKDKSKKISIAKVNMIKKELISTLSRFCEKVYENSDFFEIQPNSYEEALQRALYLKDVIENNDGYRIFYSNGKPVASENTIQRIFRLTWFASPFDVNAEVNNGRGPADYKISYGNKDSAIIEFKLAKASTLKNNLINQTEIYKKASKSIKDIKIILCYTPSEINKVNKILESIGQQGAENIVIIDATRKTSASKVQ